MGETNPRQDAKQLEFSYTVCENAKSHSHLGKQFVVSSKVKHTLTI